MWLVRQTLLGSVLTQRTSAAGARHMRPIYRCTSYPHQPVVCQLWKPPFEASAKFPKSPIWPQAVPHFVISSSITVRFPQCFLNSLPSLPFPDPETLFCPDIIRDSAGCQVDTSVIPALGELRQEDGKFQAHLGHVVKRLCGVSFCFDTAYNMRRESQWRAVRIRWAVCGERS